MGTEFIALIIGLGMLFAVSIAMAVKAKKDQDAQD